MNRENKEKIVYAQIIELAKQYQAHKIVLFGSRARGTNDVKSDIDLAVYGCEKFRDLYFALNENVDTLLEFDIVNMDEAYVDRELAAEIERDGVILYEKI